ncbi:hypothetical protein SCOCK_140037 [Actinacidiphila cocklensis]|uniref:Uncharacterized protein n=1 Tax=Actinacidiphila cocklensis TaxID=887465 RepID=A0A9W4DKH3_9ACTN|nr:hypothetical protein SCOCK_140037 [Actinacidiphila cocklensis]
MCVAVAGGAGAGCILEGPVERRGSALLRRGKVHGRGADRGSGRSAGWAKCTAVGSNGMAGTGRWSPAEFGCTVGRSRGRPHGICYRRFPEGVPKPAPKDAPDPLPPDGIVSPGQAPCPDITGDADNPSDLHPPWPYLGEGDGAA